MGLGLVAATLAGCSRKGEIDETGGIIQVRSACPGAAIPAGLGDITLFNPSGSTDSRAIDVVGVIANVKSTCSDAGEQLYTQATFTVAGTRRGDLSAAREVTLPYFSVIVRGATSVVAKRVGQVTLSFAPGQARTNVTASASSYVDKSAATLPPEIDQQLRKPRKAGDEDAAVDPLSKPEVRDAITRTSFELLIGFNLTPDQLKYNATR
ncbi:MAG TPA: hypothetical protein VF503_23060 [Sphingobium sp.]|uniref:hypothetical protein n=1 Tax=Sphingobium sp. TaxID=1912891 RepID=UPI002ED24A75